MLTNKVSPASLLSSEPSAMTENDNSIICNSQVLLFDGPSSNELFSDNAQSQSISQPLDEKFFQRPATQQPRAIPEAKFNSRQLKMQPEIPLRRMCFEKYLNKSKFGGSQKTVPSSESSQIMSSASQGSVYEEWKSSQKFSSEIESAVKEEMKEVRDEIKNELQELRAAIMEHKLGIAKTEELSAQLLASVAELRQCVELCSKDNRGSITSCLESQNTMLSKKLDSLSENLTLRIGHLEILVRSSNYTATASTTQKTTTAAKDTTAAQKTVAAAKKTAQNTTTTTAQTNVVPQNTSAAPTRLVTVKENTPPVDVRVNDQTVPSLRDSLAKSQADNIHYQDDKLTKPLKKVLLSENGSNELSTPCDIDLTQKTSSVYSQMVANISQKENTLPAKTRKGTQRRKTKNTKAKQNQAPVNPKPLITKRSQRVKRTVQYKEYESSEGDYSFQPKRRAVQHKHIQSETTPRDTVAPSPSPGEPGTCNIFSSMTPKEPTLHKQVLQPTVSQKQSGIVHRSTETARRIVEFAGLSSSTCTTLLEITNAIKNQQHGYSSDESFD